MKISLATLAFCFSQSVVSPAIAEESAQRRPATLEETAVCKEFSDFPILQISEQGGEPKFSVLSCALGTVGQYSCGGLFKLANISSEVRALQGGLLTDEQRKLEDKRYGQLGLAYEENCNFNF